MAAPVISVPGAKSLTAAQLLGTMFVSILAGSVSTVTTLANLLTFVFNKTGTFTLNGATPVTVTDSRITANSSIVITLKSVNAGTVGTSAPNVRTITVGTGFTVAGIASDTGIYNYLILN